MGKNPPVANILFGRKSIDLVANILFAQLRSPTCESARGGDILFVEDPTHFHVVHREKIHCSLAPKEGQCKRL